MILTIKEAATLLNKLAEYVPDEKVELKFLEGEPVTARSKDPLNILFAAINQEKPDRAIREKIRAHMELPELCISEGLRSKSRNAGTMSALAPKGWFIDDFKNPPEPMKDEYFRRTH